MDPEVYRIYYTVTIGSETVMMFLLKGKDFTALANNFTQTKM